MCKTEEEMFNFLQNREKLIYLHLTDVYTKRIHLGNCVFVHHLNATRLKRH